MGEVSGMPREEGCEGEGEGCEGKGSDVRGRGSKEASTVDMHHRGTFMQLSCN